MTKQVISSTEEIVLDRFEYVLPKGMYVVYKNSTGFKYQLKHTKKWFDSEDKVLEFIDKTLKERKRYQQLLKTLSVPELSKLFSDEVLLGLSPVQKPMSGRLMHLATSSPVFKLSYGKMKKN